MYIVNRQERRGSLNLLALGLCLGIVVTKSENNVPSFVIAASLAFLLVVLALLFVGLKGRIHGAGPPGPRRRGG